MGEAPGETGYVHYVLELLFTGFLDDKSRLCDLSKMINLDYVIYQKIDKLSSPKVCGCPRVPILLSLLTETALRKWFPWQQGRVYLQTLILKCSLSLTPHHV